jgi:predicted amidohydrolase YtcJ
VAQPEPAIGIRAACLRRSARGKRLPGEGLRFAAALQLFTSAAADAVFEEGEKGRISPGLLADLALIDGAPGAGARDSLRVRMTILGGKVAWAADDADLETQLRAKG